MKATRVISIITLVTFLTACGSTPIQYASPKKESSKVTLRECRVSPPTNSSITGTSYWNGNCDSGVGKGEGLAVWKTDKLVGRYTGMVTQGLLDSQEQGGVFVDKTGTFKGSIKSGSFDVGTFTMANGDKFEGKFTSTGFKQGVLRKANGDVIAGVFSGTQPVGEFFYRTSSGVYYGKMENGKITMRKPLPARDIPVGTMIAGTVVALAGAFAVVFVGATLLTGMAAVSAAAVPAARLLIIIV